LRLRLSLHDAIKTRLRRSINNLIMIDGLEELTIEELVEINNFILMLLFNYHKA